MKCGENKGKVPKYCNHYSVHGVLLRALINLWHFDSNDTFKVASIIVEEAEVNHSKEEVPH